MRARPDSFLSEEGFPRLHLGQLFLRNGEQLLHLLFQTIGRFCGNPVENVRRKSSLVFFYLSGNGQIRPATERLGIDISDGWVFLPCAGAE